MKQLDRMPHDLASRIHQKGFVAIQCDCGEVFAWDPSSAGRKAFCPRCRKVGDPILQTIAAAPASQPAPRPPIPQRKNGMPTRAEFEQLPAFAKNSVAAMADLISKAKTRLGTSEERFKGNMQNVHGLADMYDAASQQVEAMMKEMEGNGGPSLMEPSPSSPPAAVSPPPTVVGAVKA